MAVRTKAWVFSCSLVGTAGSKHAGGMDVLFLVNVVCCQVEVSATGRSPVRKGPTECGVSVCDRQTSTMSWSWPTRGAVVPWKYLY